MHRTARARVALAIILVAGAAGATGGAEAAKVARRHTAAVSGYPATISSDITLGAKVDPRPEKIRHSTRLVANPFGVSASGGYGSASSSGSGTTTIATSHGETTLTSVGSLAAAARCAKTACPGDVATAVVSSHADATVDVTFTATGTIPYRLDATLNATGHSIAPCANVDLQLDDGGSGGAHFAVWGPTTADDGDCSGGSVDHLGASVTGTLTATGTVHLLLRADTSFVDPGTRRTDRLTANWKVKLTLLAACTIDATADPGYDPTGVNVVTGTAGNDVICGGDGIDQITGAGGTDHVYAGEGDDTIAADGVLDGGAGDDTICGGGAADTIRGMQGDDLIAGAGGGDVITGEAGHDELFGGAATFCSGSGSTTDGNDRIDGGAGDDLIDGGAGRDVLAGGTGADKLRGDAGNDQLTGGAGPDVLNGGAGNDDIRAQDRRADHVFCGSGSRDRANLDAVDHATRCEFTTVLR